MLRRFEMLRALRQRNYRLWAIADFLSVAGSWMHVLGVNWLLLSLSDSAMGLGFGLFLQSMPTLLLAMLGGSLADRLPARPLVLAGQALLGTVAAALAVIAYTGVEHGAWPIYLCCLLSGAISAFCAPAVGRFGAEMVGRADLPNALALGSVISSGGRILGMGLAGMLIPVAGPGPLFVINALSFGVVIVAVLCMRAVDLHPLQRTAPDRAGVKEGLRYLRATPWLLVVFGVSFILGSLGRNYQLTMAAMSQGPLGAGAAGYGLLSVVFAVGAVLGGVYAASRSRLSFRILFTAGTLISIGQATSGMAPDLISFAALMLPIAAGAVIVDTTVATRIQLDTHENMRGRVLAAQSMVGAAAGATGGPLLGVLCDTAGPRPALVLAGVITLAVTVTAAFALLRIQGRQVSLTVPPRFTVTPGPLKAVPVPRRSETGRLCDHRTSVVSARRYHHGHLVQRSPVTRPRPEPTQPRPRSVPAV